MASAPPFAVPTEASRARGVPAAPARDPESRSMPSTVGDGIVPERPIPPVPPRSMPAVAVDVELPTSIAVSVAVAIVCARLSARR